MRFGVPTLPEPAVDQVAADLQAVLTDLVALSLQAKQAHWHVRGGAFVPVHELLDRIAADARDWSDAVAERAVTLGRAVDGRPGTIAAASSVGDVPEGFLTDDKAVSLLADAVATTAATVRSRLDATGEADPVTQDLLIEVLGGLEKHLWFLQAQR